MRLVGRVRRAESYQPLCWGDAEMVAYLLCAKLGRLRRAGRKRFTGELRVACERAQLAEGFVRVSSSPPDAIE